MGRLRLSKIKNRAVGDALNTVEPGFKRSSRNPELSLLNTMLHCLLDTGHWLGHAGDTFHLFSLLSSYECCPYKWMRQIWGGGVYHSALRAKFPTFFCVQVRPVNLVLCPSYTTGALNLKNG